MSPIAQPATSAAKFCVVMSPTLRTARGRADWGRPEERGGSAAGRVRFPAVRARGRVPILTG
ncbi:hypothetical protein GCM10009751_29410 [Myceligenerans crystallogenes]|uniref:Uncharacterized protein n=1 Tax=Myceligenerans crystallogenes TaxID=316335 RepID=A0ABN2NJ08_9MICO